MKSVSEKKSRGHQTSTIVKSNQTYSNSHLPYHCSFQHLARARSMHGVAGALTNRSSFMRCW